MKTPESVIRAMQANDLLNRLRQLAGEAGAQVYPVGGVVRDWFRTGDCPADVDVMLIDAPARQVAKALADSMAGHLVPLDEAFGIHRVVLDGGITVDLADALENDLHTDLARRDLTVNAMAVDLEAGVLQDPLGGLDDLRAGRIRMVSAHNLLDDPLRMLRVFRVAATLQADQIDADTLAVVRAHAPMVWQSAAERIQYELLRLLSVPVCFPALQAMADSGLLEVIIPDLAPMREVPPSGYHHLGLFEHTLELVRQAERLLPELSPAMQARMAQPLGQGGTRFGVVKLGCLLHDIGKPATRGTKMDPVHGERLTFYGHDEVGEQMADPWLRRLKASNELRDWVKNLIRWHLYPCQFGPDSPRKSVLRFYRRLGDAAPDVTLLALADRYSATGPWLDPADLTRAHQAHVWLMDNYEAEQAVLQMPRLLDGRQVMEALSVPPGPHLKIMMAELQEAQQLGEIQTGPEALQWLQARYPKGLIRPTDA